MMRLVRVELMRARSRVLLWCLAFVAVALSVAVTFGAWQASQPPSQQELEQAQWNYDQAMKDYEEYGEEQEADCLEQEAAEREAMDDPTIDFGCDWKPRLEDFQPYRATFVSEGSANVTGLAIPLLLLVAAAATSLVAAEFSTGSISNWLTFAPRRGRVFGSKVASVVLWALPVAALTAAIATGGTWLAFSLNDALGDPATVNPMKDPTAPDPLALADVVAMGGRLVVAALAFAAIGAGLAFLLRHTAAVLGAVVAWAAVVEGLARGLRPGLQPYLVLVNVEAWIKGGTRYWVDECGPDPDSGGAYVCTSIEKTVSLAHGGIYLAIVTVVVVGLAYLVFRRRDAA